MPTKVFVGNLPEDCAQETIRDVFGSYGGIDDVAIIKNFAFVHFSNEGDANNAVRDLDGSKIGGKQINVEISKKQDNNNNNRGRRDNRDRDRNRDRDQDRDRDRGGARRGGRGGPDNRIPNNAGGILGAGPLAAAQLLGIGGPQLQGFGGPPLGLGAGLGGLGGLGGPAGVGNAPLGGLGILSAGNILAAVAEKQQQLSSGQQQLSSGQQQQQQQPSSVPERRHERDQPDPDVRVRREVVHTRDVPNAASMGLNSGYVIYERYYVDATHPLLKGLPLPELPRMPDSVPSARDNTRTDTRRDNFNEYRDRSPVNNGRRLDNDRDRDYQR